MPGWSATRVGVGTSAHGDARSAARAAARAALKQGELTECSFAIVFATPGHDHAALVQSVSDALKGAPVTGCSAHQVTGNTTLLESTYGVAVMAFGEGAGLRVASGSDVATVVGAARDAGLAQAKAVLCFADAAFDCRDLRRELDRAAGRAIPFVGTVATDVLGTAHVYAGTQVMTHGAALVLVGGDADVFAGTFGGAVAASDSHTVTACDGRTVLAFDGSSAAEAFATALGTWTTPNGVLLACVDGRNIPVRLVDHARGSLELATPLAIGTVCRFAVPDRVTTTHALDHLLSHERPARAIVAVEPTHEAGHPLLRLERMKAVRGLRATYHNALWIAGSTWGAIDEQGGLDGTATRFIALG